jgi:exodeoxyribonuclease III
MERSDLSILSWNILHGGGARRTPGIVLALLEWDSDVVVLSEFRSRMGGQIAGVLADHGWRYQVRTDPEPGVNGMFVAAREPIRVLDWNCPEPRRGVSVMLEHSSVVVTAVHIPDARASDARALGRKSLFWHSVLDHVSGLRDWAHVLIGDFNTGRHRQDERGSTFTSVALLGRLTAMGYRDAYRIVEPDGRAFSWESAQGGRYRLDHAFVSKCLCGCVFCAEYGHVERSSGLSDHAILRLKLGKNGQNVGEMTKTSQKQGNSGCRTDKDAVQDSPCSVAREHPRTGE